MTKPLLPADLARVTTIPLASRANEVRVDEFARPVAASSSLGDFLDGLPDVLAVKVVRELAAAVVQARAEARPVVVAAGADVVTAGLAPVLIGLMEEGVVTGLALTGAGAIHDWEIAAIGATSEDVGRGLHAGRYGMADETARALNDAAREAAAAGTGFGETLGRRIAASRLPHRASSLLARAAELAIPATVHVAVGADVVHQHPSADGSAIGAATFTDFRKAVTIVCGLTGGVWINAGSAVLLPQIFLTALSVARNMGHDVAGFVTADLDLVRRPRTEESVVRQPTLGRGRGFSLTGHLEILVPLIAAAVGLERARRESSR
jgi:hypothetical protein